LGLLLVLLVVVLLLVVALLPVLALLLTPQLLLGLVVVADARCAWAFDRCWMIV
jgi:hypothetical protein